MLLLGRGTVFEPIFARFANPVLLWWTCRLAPGGPNSLSEAMLGWVCGFFALLFAWTGFPPTHIQFGDDHGVNGLIHPRRGACVWAASTTGRLIALTPAFWRDAVIKSGS